MESTNLRSVCEIFLKYTREIHRKTTATDPNFLRVSAACGKIEQFIEGVFPASTKMSLEQMRRQAERHNAKLRNHKYRLKIRLNCTGFMQLLEPCGLSYLR